MKILYATYRYDPTNPDLGSSLDYECYCAFINLGHQVEIVGPIADRPTIIERLEIGLWQVYKQLTNKGGLKFPLTTAIRASRLLEKATKTKSADVIFSVYPPFFVFKQLALPSVWYFDTTFIGQEREWPLYGKLAVKASVFEEKRAFRNAHVLVTMSDWSKQVMVSEYGADSQKIQIVPLAATLPNAVTAIDRSVVSSKTIDLPVRLLLVGRVYERKGIDIAIEIVNRLNHSGLPSELIICGINEKKVASPFVTFVGPYKKSDPLQLQEYVNLYKWAHLLIHPARFEAGGTVLSEAAAFGTPSLTNATGGLATSVKDGVSGIVLPKGSPPESYVRAIKDLVNDPARYKKLCLTTRERYEEELNWDVVGKQLVKILEDAVREHELNQGRNK